MACLGRQRDGIEVIPISPSFQTLTQRRRGAKMSGGALRAQVKMKD